jgi:transcriptional regulator GlxA family with amidase domain
MMSPGEGGTGDVPSEPARLLLLLRNTLTYTHTASLSVKTLLLTVLSSITEVVILCTAGYILARAGILDKPTQRKLNIVNGAQRSVSFG